MSNTLATIQNQNAIIRQLIDTVRREMFVDTAGVVLFDHQKKSCHTLFIDEDSDKSKDYTKDVLIAYDDPLLTLLSREKKMITKYDIAEDPRYSDVKEVCGKRFSEMNISLALPLTYQDEVKGFFTLGHKKSGHFYTREDIDFLETLSNAGTVAIENARLFRERQNIKKAFSYYLPDELVDKLARNIASLKTHSQQVYGTCLATDAEQYTTLSETMEPNDLRNYINKYFEVLFKPVKHHGGMVANVLADSMLATWMTDQPDVDSRKNACISALEIDREVHRFNMSLNTTPLPTRIGLHSGKTVLASLGAEGHYEYRPVGDIVNTATRIEGLNKYLGTRILVSEVVLYELDTFLTRNLGEFLLKGKTKPLKIHELICIRDEADEHQTKLCVLFSEGLAAYRNQSWKEAIEKFSSLSKRYGEDGPSLFYKRLCEEYYEKPPGESWTGVVRMDKK